MAAKDIFGHAGEDRAAQHLSDHGYRILARNWRCSQGEIDIVAERAGVICIVEVKTRTSLSFGHPFDAVDERKRERLWRLGYAWCRDNAELARNSVLRVDVVGIVGPDPHVGVLEHLVDLR